MANIFSCKGSRKCTKAEYNRAKAKPTQNKWSHTILTGIQSLIMTGKAIATVLIDRKMVKRMKMKI